MNHSPQDLIRELAPLRDIFPGKATRNWLAKTAFTIWQLEATGATHFGGPEVLAWWLVQRCQPKAPLSKAKAKQLVQMCGRSQKALDLMVAMTEDRAAPSRLQTGWDFMKVNSYLSLLKAERLPGRLGG